MVACVEAQLGKPYVWGTHGPGSFDCSGLVGFCFRRATGRDIGFGSVQQYGLGKAVTTPRPGDVGFWDTFGAAPGHNAVYDGKGGIVHALNEDAGVVRSDLPVQQMGGANRFMGWRNLGLRDDEPATPVQPGPINIGAAAPYVTAMLPIVASTPFRATGTLDAARVHEILAAVDSPMTGEASAIAAAAPGMNAQPLAQSYMESRYGLDESAQATHNPLGLLWYPGMVPVMPVDDSNAHGVPLIIFDSWAAAFAEWYRRMTSEDYKGGVYMPRDMPIERMIRIYVAGPGPGYANNESAESVATYLRNTIARLNRYHGLHESSHVENVPSDLIYRVDHIPQGNRNRPGDPINTGGPHWITVHETANENFGANAEMHRRFVHEGGGDESVSFHLTVDDEEAIELLPFHEIGWHAGDGCDSRQNDLGCFDSIAIETCVNQDGNWTLTKRNLSKLLAKLVRENDTLSLDRVAPHNKWSGKDCPHKMRAEGSLPQVIADARQLVIG